jgi:hypothetical protein
VHAGEEFVAILQNVQHIHACGSVSINAKCKRDEREIKKKNKQTNKQTNKHITTKSKLGMKKFQKSKKNRREKKYKHTNNNSSSSSSNNNNNTTKKTE